MVDLWLGTIALVLLGLTFVFLAASTFDLLTSWEQKKEALKCFITRFF